MSLVSPIDRASADKREHVSFVSGWQIDRIIGANDRGCVMTANYNSGLAVSFYRFRSQPGYAVAEFVNPSWTSIENGKRYNLRAKVNGRKPFEVIGIGRVNGNSRAIVFPVEINEYLRWHHPGLAQHWVINPLEATTSVAET